MIYCSKSLKISFEAHIQLRIRYMNTDLDSPLATWVSEISSSGRTAFTRDEAFSKLNIDRRLFSQALKKLQQQNLLISPKRGFYVIVPPKLKVWGAPPPYSYIDELMKFKDCPYYVGLLDAAYLHGATHQAVLWNQLVVGKRFSNFYAGRSAVSVHFCKNFKEVSAGIEVRHFVESKFLISCPELTVFDLIRFSHAGAGFDNIATVLTDLGDSLNAVKLANISSLFGKTVSQRLGYILDFIGYESLTAKLHNKFSKSSFDWTELTPVRTKYADILLPPLERDPKWKIIVRLYPESDI